MTNLEEAKKREDLTDWERVKSMSEEEIEANAASDPENPPLSSDCLKNTPKVRRNRHRDLLKEAAKGD